MAEMKRSLAYPEVLLAAACFLFLFLRRGRGGGSSRPTNWPLLGMLPCMLSQLHRFHDWVTELLRESGCTFLFRGPWFTGMNVIATADPANINHIFNANFANYPKGEQFLEMFDILGGGIFNADADSWKSQRKAAHSLIGEPRFRRFVAETSRDKVERGVLPVLSLAAAEGGSAVDLQDVFLRFTFDVTSTLVFGVDPGCLAAGLPVVPFASAMDDAEEVLFYRHTVPRAWWKLLRRLRLGEERKMAVAWAAIDDIIGRQISKKMEETSKAGEDKGDQAPTADLLTSYLNRRPEALGAAVGSVNEFLRDTTVNLMLAGRDTTAAALSWFFWLVAQNPEVEQRILDELRTVAPPRLSAETPAVFDAEELSSAVYLQAALSEALRLYPPVPFEHKSALRPDVLPSGDKVYPATNILFSFYSMARMEGIWGEDCRQFRPERWISERGRLRHEPSYKFVSFNSGPRTCLGKDVAFTQMKVVAAAVVRNFRIKLVEGHVVTPKLSIILHMKNGLMVTVEKRTAAAA